MCARRRAGVRRWAPDAAPGYPREGWSTRHRGPGRPPSRTAGGHGAHPPAPRPPAEPGSAWVSRCRLLCWLLVKETLVPGGSFLGAQPRRRESSLWLLRSGVWPAGSHRRGAGRGQETRLLGHSSHGRINNQRDTRVTHRKGTYSLLEPVSVAHVREPDRPRQSRSRRGLLSNTRWDSHSGQAVCSVFPT